MKRPQRNLLIILSSIAVIWVLLRLMPLSTGLWIAAGLLALGLILSVLGRDFLVARYRSRRRDWAKAIASYQRFEKMLLTSRLGDLLVPLYLGIYTFDGVAITRNNIAQALMNLGKLEEAEGWLRSALQRDPMYATPYINLGTIAVMRGQESHARRHFQRAVDLGYSATGAQQALAKALARANQAVGKVLE